MKDHYLLIDEIAQQLGITKRTIRYYEEQGLLSPVTRTEKGYRLYAPEDMERLRRIIELRDTTGFSLKDIREILEIEDTVATSRNTFHNAGSPDSKRQMLIRIKSSLERFLELIGQKQAQLNKIQSIYQEKLNRVEKFIKELE